MLLAEGRTNREIGERLFISQKTVGVHVGNILAKLEVSGRVEAADRGDPAGDRPIARSAGLQSILTRTPRDPEGGSPGLEGSRVACPRDESRVRQRNEAARSVAYFHLKPATSDNAIAARGPTVTASLQARSA